MQYSLVIIGFNAGFSYKRIPLVLHGGVFTECDDLFELSISICNHLCIFLRLPRTNAIQFKRWEKRGVRPEDMDFRIYTLMDTDDCSDEMLARYKSGKMFHDLWLAPFIVPIWCTPNTDGVFYRAKLIPQIKSDRDKVPTYKKYFPIVKDGSLGIGEAEQICSALKGRRDTNISIFIDDCISRAKHALINPNQLHKN